MQKESLQDFQITVHSFECENADFSDPLTVLIKFGSNLNWTELFLENLHTFPITDFNQSFQILIKNGITNESLGSISLRLDEVKRLKAQLRKHWVTLFDDPDDDLYDGDYMEDDSDVPRILISYQLMDAPKPLGDLNMINTVTEKIEESTKIEEKEMNSNKLENDHPAQVSDILYPSEQNDEIQIQDPIQISQTPEAEQISAHEPKMEEDSLMKDMDQPIPDPICTEEDSLPTFGGAESRPSQKLDGIQKIEMPNEKPEVKIQEIQQTNSQNEAEMFEAMNKTMKIEAPIDMSKDLVEVLTTQNKKLRDEVHMLEDEKSNILGKLQTEVQDYDGRISILLKEKFELKEKVVSLQQDLEMANKKSNELTIEIDQITQKMESELKMRDESMTAKMMEYENMLEEFKMNQSQMLLEKNNTDSPSKTMDGPQNSIDYLQKLSETESKYMTQLAEMQKKLELLELEKAEKMAQLAESLKKQEEITFNIENLMNENNVLKEEKLSLMEKLNKTIEKMNLSENLLCGMEKAKNCEIYELNQRIMKMMTELAKLGENLETMKHENEEKQGKLAEKENEIKIMKNESESYKTHMNSQLEIMKKEYEKKVEMMESEKMQMLKMKNENSEDMKKMQDLLTNTKLELMKKSGIEENLAEKIRLIESLNQIIADLKNMIEQLKRKNTDFEQKLMNVTTESEKSKQNIEQLNLSLASKDDKIKYLDTELINMQKKLQEKQTELSKKDQMLKNTETENENLKTQLKEKTQQMLEFENEQKRRSERLDDIAQKAKETEREIENLRLRSKNKEEKLQEASIKLMQKSKEMRQLEAQMYQIQEELNAAKNTMKKENDENEQLRKELAQARKEADDMKSMLIAYKQMANNEEFKENSNVIYTPDTSDKVDQMFAFYINETKCPVQLKKTGEGQYLFGTKKIFAKIQNEKLVIRVGGGYMMIDEFLSVYTAQELSKLQRAVANSEAETEGSATKCPGSFIKNASKEIIIEGDQETENANPTSNTSRKRSENHLVFLKSTSKDFNGTGKIPGSVTLRSKSPTANLINGTTRARILTEQDMTNTKIMKGVGNVIPTKSKVNNGGSEIKGEELENDSSLAKKGIEQ